MKRRVVALVVLAIVMAGFGVWFAIRRSHSVEKKSAAEVTAKDTSLPKKVEKYAERAVSSVTDSIGFGSSYPAWQGGKSIGLNDPRWKVVDEREKTDTKWEWKMPIQFYGKVVDQNEQPVPDAKIHFTWTDLSPDGSSERETKSDGNGLFTLHGAKGKSLGVQVSKEGYDAMRAKNQYAFEYAGFWEKNYYEPDSNNPVLFHLRRKGEAQPMVYWEKEIKIAIGAPAIVQIDPQTQIQLELLLNELVSNRSRWEARVTMLGGELTLATEEFPYEAPASSYTSGMAIDPKTPKPPTWTYHEGGAFYIKAGSVYGRMNIEMIPGRDWFRIKVWLNPSGSRNLEPDPKLLFPNLDAYNRYMAKQKQTSAKP